MTHSHGMDGPSHQSFRVVDTAVHNTEFGLSAGLDYNAVHLVINGRHQADWVNGIADSGQFRMQIYEVNRKLHKGGLLPHLHIAVDDQNGGHFMPHPESIRCKPRILLINRIVMANCTQAVTAAVSTTTTAAPVLPLSR